VSEAYRGRTLNVLDDDPEWETVEQAVFKNILDLLPDQSVVPTNDVCLVNEHKHIALYATTAIRKVGVAAAAVTFYADDTSTIAIMADTLLTLYQPFRANNTNGDVRIWESTLLALSSTLSEGTKTATALVLETENTTWDSITNKPLISFTGTAGTSMFTPIKTDVSDIELSTTYIKVEVNGVMTWLGPLYKETP